MTDIQNKYWALQETKRSNRAQEHLRSQELGETSRHNRATEELTASDIAEKVRHNLATEDVQIGELKEKQRHNKATEGIQAKQASASMIQAMASKSQAESAALRAASDVLLTQQKVKTEEYNTSIAASKAIGEIARTNEAIANADIASVQADYVKANKAIALAGSVVDLFNK